MDEDEKTLLEETAKLAKQNNRMLKSMRREARIGQFLHALKYIAIIFVLIWSYMLIQPYLAQVQEIYTSMKGAQESIGDLQGKIQIDPSQFENLLKSFNLGN